MSFRTDFNVDNPSDNELRIFNLMRRSSEVSATAFISDLGALALYAEGHFFAGSVALAIGAVSTIGAGIIALRADTANHRNTTVDIPKQQSSIR